MKILFYTFLLLLAFSCTKKESKVPDIFQLKSSNAVTQNNDVLYWKKKKFSGYCFELNSKNDTLLLEGYVNGLLHGFCKKWYPNKQLQEVRFYKNGKKDGKQMGYWENGNKRFSFFCSNEAYEGELKEWTFDGKLIHHGHYENGQEEGSQKLWYNNGKIRANYVIIKGKRYGLLGTKNCKNVSDSIFIVQ